MPVIMCSTNRQKDRQMDKETGFVAQKDRQMDKETICTVRAARRRKQMINKINASRLGRDTDTPEPEEVAMDLGLVVAPARGAQGLGRTVERAATDHPTRTIL